MFKSLIMWLNIQLFQFLLIDYPRYMNEWQDIKNTMENEEKQRKQLLSAPNIQSHDDIDHDPEDNEDTNLVSSTPTSTSKSSKSVSKTLTVQSGCCDFNFKCSASNNDVDQYDGMRLTDTIHGVMNHTLNH